MKKPFKDTKIGGILKFAMEGALDIIPLPTAIKKVFDADKDGKIGISDLKHYTAKHYAYIAGAATVIAILIKLELLNLETFLEVLKSIFAS